MEHMGFTFKCRGNFLELGMFFLLLRWLVFNWDHHSKCSMEYVYNIIYIYLYIRLHLGAYKEKIHIVFFKYI